MVTSCGLAVARNTLNANVLRIDCRVGFEVVEPATRTPGPRAQGSPVFGLARLSLVYQPDDAAGDAGTVVCLHAGRIE